MHFAIPYWLIFKCSHVFKVTNHFHIIRKRQSEQEITQLILLNRINVPNSIQVAWENHCMQRQIVPYFTLTTSKSSNRKYFTLINVHLSASFLHFDFTETTIKHQDWLCLNSTNTPLIYQFKYCHITSHAIGKHPFHIGIVEKKSRAKARCIYLREFSNKAQFSTSQNLCLKCLTAFSVVPFNREAFMANLVLNWVLYWFFQ